MPPHPETERRVFGSAVRGIRRERQLTQEAVARAGGIGRKYPGQVERGELDPGLTSMVRLARGLGMHEAEFFHRVADAFAAAGEGDGAPSARRRPSPAG